MSEPTVGHTAASEAAAQPATFDAAVDAACARIAPAWPLDRLIAVNPYWGFVSQPIEDAAAHLTALSGTRMVMPRAWYRARYQEQTLTERHIQLAIEQSGSALDATKVLACLEAPEPAESRYPTVVDVIDASRDLSHAVSYDELVTRQLSQACAAYVDRAQASWPLSREGGFYAGFRRLLAEDASPRLLVGRAGLAAASRALPTEPRALLRHALEVLGVTPSEREDYLTALLLSILGWASAFAFTRWEARLTGGDDEDIVHLLAARLTWELLLYQEVASADVRQTVRRARASFRSRPLAARTAGIAAPRERTRGLNLGGRVFLHEYRPAEDEGFRVLEQIMCAPMVVAHMIGMQYYASTVDNPRYGSGNKVLHNVVGGTVGVFEGAGGDLRIGLALQSLHDGSDWVHTPQRLSVLLEAPRDAIDAIVTKHALVRDLVENEWLFLFSIEPGGGAVYRRTASGWRGGEYA